LKEQKTMNGRPRKNHGAATKGEQLLELGQRFDLQASRISQWNSNCWIGRRMRLPRENAAQAGPIVEDMKAKIGQLALRKDILGKRRAALSIIPPENLFNLSRPALWI
jgi:hypothetical protein